MAHQHIVKIRKGSLCQHLDLPALCLLAGGADHIDRAPQLVCKAAQGCAGAGSHGSDHIVAAAMAQALQGIIFRQKGDAWPWLPSPLHRSKRRWESGCPCLHGKALASQKLRQLCAGKILLKAAFRVIVDLMGQLKNPAGKSVTASFSLDL